MLTLFGLFKLEGFKELSWLFRLAEGNVELESWLLKLAEGKVELSWLLRLAEGKAETCLLFLLPTRPALQATVLAALLTMMDTSDSSALAGWLLMMCSCGEGRH